MDLEGNPFGQRPGQQAKMDQALSELLMVARVAASYWKALVTNGMSEHAATAMCIAMQDSWTQQAR